MKKILIVLGLVFGIAIVVLAVGLVRDPIEHQNPFSVLSIEEIAVRHAKGMTVAGFRIDPNTVEAIQKVEINDMALVLVQYNGYRTEGEAELCEMVLEIEKKPLKQWKANGGSGLCHKMNDPLNTVPITVVSGYGTSTLLDRGYSTAFGYLRDDQITKVVVTWEDGLVEPANVRANTYLTVRSSGFHVEKVETYNNIGEVVFESDYPNTEESKH